MSQNSKQPLGAGLFGKESAVSFEVYLNLTPLMDVMSNILFFLMAAFGASAVAFFSVTVPVDATGEPAGAAPAEDKVTVTMRADASGIALSCQDPMKLPDELKVCNRYLAVASSAGASEKAPRYDTAALNTALADIKAKFPGANTVVFVPDDELTYETIVSVLDATREYKTPQGKKLSLFPDIVMSSLVK